MGGVCACFSRRVTEEEKEVKRKEKKKGKEKGKGKGLYIPCTCFSHSPIKVGYTFKRVLQKGTFGIVSEVERCSDGVLFAYKCVPFTQLEQYEEFQGSSSSNTLCCASCWSIIPFRIQNEMQAMQQLRGQPEILNLIEMRLTQGCLHMIVEKCRFDLFTRLQHNRLPMSANQIKSIVFQLLSGLNACHLSGWIHCDLRSENILLKENKDSEEILFKDAVIADFGCAEQMDKPGGERDCEGHQDTYGIDSHRAPEMLLFQFQRVSGAIDVWALACVWYDMLFQDTLFQGDTVLDVTRSMLELLGIPPVHLYADWPQKENVLNTLSRFPAYPPSSNNNTLQTRLRLVSDLLDEDGRDLFTQMLQYHPDERITSSEALQHPYFQQKKKKKTKLFHL